MREVAEFVAEHVRFTVDAIGTGPLVAVGLAVVLVIGLPLAVRHAGDIRSSSVSVALGLAGGALVFVLTTALGRVAGSAKDGAGASASRYLHITAALLLPVMAVAASAIAARWRVWLVPMALLFVLGIPLNVRGAVRDVDKAEPDVTAYRDKILTTARLPIARELRARCPRSPSCGRSS